MTRFKREGIRGVKRLVSHAAIVGQILGERVEQMMMAMVFCAIVLCG